MKPMVLPICTTVASAVSNPILAGARKLTCKSIVAV
jgi:hypothetical protein